MIIAFDPSINETGWAYALNGRETSGVIKTKGDNNPAQIRDLIMQLSRIMRDLSCTTAIIEVAEGFTYSRSSNYYGKSKNQKSLYINAKAVGAIIGQLVIRDIQVIEIGATFWKGKMGKGIAQTITQKSNNNEADAIMLLRWWIDRGQFIRTEDWHGNNYNNL